MIRILLGAAVVASALLLSACGTTDGSLRDQGRSESYLQGFHDGRHSGMKEAGNTWEHYIRDHDRFDSDTEYKQGWLAGESEGKQLQAQAKAVGEAMGSGYTGYKVGKEVDKNAPDAEKAAKNAMKGADTSELNKLGK